MQVSSNFKSIVRRLLVGRSSRPLLSILVRLDPIDIASMFGQLDQRESLALVEALVSIKKAGAALNLVPATQLARVLEMLSPEQTLELLVYSTVDEAAYIATQLPLPLRETVLMQLELPRRRRIQQYLDYPANSVGRLMQSPVFNISSDLTTSEAIGELRKRASNEAIYYIYCTNEEGQLTGVISLRSLVTTPPDLIVADLMKRDIVQLEPLGSEREAAKLVAHYDLIALPVVNSQGELVGVVTVDDVLDILQEQATAEVYAQVGLAEDDRVYTPMVTSARNRLPWMALNLLLAGIASSVISLFEQTMSQLILLATLKNIVAGIGGNTAIQSLTVVTRGLATGDFSFTSHSQAIIKETLVGCSMGLFTGVLAGLLTYIWKADLLVSVVICVAMVINCLIGAIAGAVMPIALTRLGRDPAIGSGVLVTMLTDIFGFLGFLGLAALSLKYFAPGTIV